MKTNQNSMSTGISYLIAVVIYGTALTNADQDRKRGLISMLLQVIIDLDQRNSRKKYSSQLLLHQLGGGEVLVQREVEVDVALRVSRQHGGDHEVGFVDRDQGGHFVVRDGGLDYSRL